MDRIGIINDYLIISSDSTSDLSSQVIELIPHGWQPYGSAYGATSGNSGNTYHYQPMVQWTYNSE